LQNIFESDFKHTYSMPIYPQQRVFYPQNRPCTSKIVGTFCMQGYKVKEKTAIVQTEKKPWTFGFKCTKRELKTWIFGPSVLKKK
jgi:hypothetical protein